MVNKKLIKLVIPLFFVIMLLGIFIAIEKNHKAVNEFESLHFNGIVGEKTYLKYKKSLFIFVNNNWYGIMDYPLEQYIEKGDSIYKTDSSKCIIIKKNKYSNEKRFCNSYAYLVKDNSVIKKLNLILNNDNN